MCIFLTTCAHPQFPFILISNRDEYFKRQTSPADFDGNILCPHDLANPSHGTWIGVSKTGRIGVLVNFKEKKIPEIGSDANLSRGTIVKDFLNSSLDVQQWKQSFHERFDDSSLQKMGGFSFLFGILDLDNKASKKKISPLYILSNRGATAEIFVDKSVQSGVQREKIEAQAEAEKKNGIKNNDSAKGEDKPKENKEEEESKDQEMQDKKEDTHENGIVQSTKSYIGLSNSLFYNPWPKVLVGENLLTNLIISAINENWDQNKLIKELFKLLSFNCVKSAGSNNNDPNSKQLDMESVQEEMKSSIFIPPLKTPFFGDPEYEDNKYVGDYYGTRTQTIILLSKDGDLTYIEKTLHQNDNLNGPRDSPEMDSAVSESVLPFVSYTSNIFNERERAI